ncbi:hypothetical protein ABZY68_33265 [Streptomyces sp. NPDC006482]
MGATDHAVGGRRHYW